MSICAAQSPVQLEAEARLPPSAKASYGCCATPHLTSHTLWLQPPLPTYGYSPRYLRLQPPLRTATGEEPPAWHALRLSTPGLLSAVAIWPRVEIASGLWSSRAPEAVRPLLPAHLAADLPTAAAADLAAECREPQSACCVLPRQVRAGDRIQLRISSVRFGMRVEIAPEIAVEAGDRTEIDPVAGTPAVTPQAGRGRTSPSLPPKLRPSPIPVPDWFAPMHNDSRRNEAPAHYLL